MNCRDWEDRLALYVGGDLPRAEAEAVERHLGECPGCQLFSSGLTEARDLLVEAHREPLAPAHFAAVRARVIAELERQSRPFWQRGWVYGCAAAAAAILVLLLLKPLVKPELKPPAVAITHPPAPTLAAQEPAPIPAAPVTTRRPSRPKGQPGEPVLIRMVSNNPDVVIYWIADTRGE